jgi:hypothetical protein
VVCGKNVEGKFNSVQVKAIADWIEEAVKKQCDEPAYKHEGSIFLLLLYMMSPVTTVQYVLVTVSDMSSLFSRS